MGHGLILDPVFKLFSLYLIIALRCEKILRFFIVRQLAQKTESLLTVRSVVVRLFNTKLVAVAFVPYLVRMILPNFKHVCCFYIFLAIFLSCVFCFVFRHSVYLFIKKLL